MSDSIPKIKFKKRKQSGQPASLKKKKAVVRLEQLDEEQEAGPKGDLNQKPETKKTSALAKLAEQEDIVKQNTVISDELEEEKRDPEDVELDREWYTGDDFGHTFGDESHNPFGIENEIFDQEKEQKLKKSAIKRMSAERKSRVESEELWENNRMLNSGAVRRKFVDLDFRSDYDQLQYDVLVQYKTPKFLAQHSIYSNQKGPVLPFRDPESDMAVFSKRGSLLVKERIHSSEKKKSAKGATDLAGTVLGNVIGEEEDEEPEEGNVENNSKFIADLEEASDHENNQGSDFSRKLTLKQQRKFLPAYTVREDLLRVIDENQVVVVIGETGSGKTTQLAQYLYEHGYGNRGMIGCTQPRRVAAMSVAKRVAEEMETKLGDKVGFSIRFEDYTSENTVIRYMTDGILLKETLTDRNLMKYSCIIIDEAHERTLNTDILLGLFKRILSKRMDIKIIVTSATMNADKFSRFFGAAPQFTIPGRTFPVEIMYSRVTPSDYVESAVKTCMTIHLTKEAGDVLVFLTGKVDIDTFCEVLAEKFKSAENESKDFPDYEIMPIYSQMPADLQVKVFRQVKKGTRKFVVATNIAETSLTIDNIRFVVDAGYYKLKIFNSKMGMDALEVAPISLANANQRSGRAGRTAPGVAYRLYSHFAAKNELYSETIPEIQRTNLANTMLLLKSLEVKNILGFPFLDPPPELTIVSSLYELWTMGALDEDGQLTPLGSRMARFPMEPSLSKLLINSIDLGCSEEMITIVSMLSVPNVFYRPKERQEQSDAIREKFFVPESDHLTLLNVYSQWKANNFSAQWCTRHFLHLKSLRRAKDIRSQLVTIMRQQKLPIKSSGTDWDAIRKCICSGYCQQAAKVKGFGKYSNLKTGLELNLHPTSALFGLGDLPKYIIYHELILTTKEYMSYVTEVDAKWLVEYGSAFYTLKKRKVEYSNNTIWGS